MVAKDKYSTSYDLERGKNNFLLQLNAKIFSRNSFLQERKKNSVSHRPQECIGRNNTSDFQQEAHPSEKATTRIHMEIV